MLALFVRKPIVVLLWGGHAQAVKEMWVFFSSYVVDLIFFVDGCALHTLLLSFLLSCSYIPFFMLISYVDFFFSKEFFVFTH